MMIKLKELEKKHVIPFYDWINDDEVIKYSLSIFQQMKSKETIDKWFYELIRDTKVFKQGIFLKSNHQLIGYCGICNISNWNKSGEYFIFIGDKKHWGKGISTQVTQQIINVGFQKLDLNRIMLTVSEPNIGGIKSYQKAGFKKEGVLKEACFRDNQYHDKLIMAILKND